MQFTRVQSVFEWITDLCQLNFDPIFTTFFITVRAFVLACVRIRSKKSGPSQGEDDFTWAYTQPNCFVPRADFPHSRKFYFLVSVKRFFFIFVSTSLGVFLERQICQG